MSYTLDQVPRKGDRYRHYLGDAYTIVGVSMFRAVPDREPDFKAAHADRWGEFDVYTGVLPSGSGLVCAENGQTRSQVTVVMQSDRGEYWACSIESFLEEAPSFTSRDECVPLPRFKKIVEAAQ